MCKEWNELILDCKELAPRKNNLDLYEEISRLHAFGTLGKKDGQFMFPTGVFVFLDKIVVCDCSNGTVQIFDERGKFVDRVDVKDPYATRSKTLSIGPYRGCVVNGSTWIVNRWNRTVCIFDSTSMSHSIPLAGFYPLAICSTPSGMILMTTEENIVLVLDEDGYIVNKFDSIGKLDGQFQNARGICCNSKNEILIADCDNHRIQIFSQQGCFIRSFGSKGNLFDQFYFPMGICVDREDNVFVADSGNNRIFVFDPNGLPIQQIPIENPQDVCLMGRKIIAISGNNSIVILGN